MLSASVVGDASNIILQSSNANSTLSLNNTLKNSINTARNNDESNRISSLTIVDGVLPQYSSWTFSNTWIHSLDLTDFNANNNEITFNSGGEPATTHIESVNLTGAKNLSVLNLSNQTELTNVGLGGVTSLTTLNLTGVNLEGLTITVDSEEVIGEIIPETDSEGNTIDYASHIQTGPSGMADSDGCYISIDETNKIATVHTPTAGHFAALFNKHINYNSDYDGYTFKFDSESNVNEDDLKVLAGGAAFYNSNKYYVDLFDLPATTELCGAGAGIITNVIKWMRNTNVASDQVKTRQFKGLILPKDHTQYGIGTTLIQGEAPNTAGQVATCSEFIAYYKSKEENGEDSEKNLTVSHVYDATNTNSTQYAKNLAKMISLLSAHEDVENNTDIYQISTNSAAEIDLSGVPTNKARIETYNNEMVTGTTRANITAYPVNAGDFAGAVSATSIQKTTTEKLTIVGDMSEADFTAISSFTEGNGPRVLDLSKVTTEITEALLKKITNSKIEYIVLPNNIDKSVIMADYSSNMSGLNAVINASASATSQPAVTANIYKAGSLYEARCHAVNRPISTDGKYYLQDGGYGLKTVTLAGKLNAADINAGATTVGADGHYKASGATGSTTSGLLGETVTTIDLTDAVFETQTDMNFAGVGLSSLSDVKLPTSREMTLISDRCFNGMQSLKELCVPYNYTKFGNAVFLDSYLEHLTTTDSEGALIDNGPKTYTFSKNLQEIGNDPGANEDGVKALSEIVFPQNRGVTDVYVLAHKVPKCYANAFPANMLYGWGGFKGGDFPYCREKYDNSNDGSLIFTVLHFPDEASFNAAAANMKETITSTDADAGLGPDAYTKMRQLYTDINKIYSMKEQTGAVDANGKAITWPTFSELRRTYNQATEGLTWNDWSTEYDTNHEVNGGDNIPSKATSIPAGNGNGDYSFTDYEGWHQFTLALATYVAPDETNVEDGVITREYVETDQWYTFCIPYSITADQLKKMLGVPASTDKVINKVYKKNGTTVVDEVSTGHNPEVRTLNGVVRTPGTPNTVIFSFTQPLVVDGNEEYKYLEIKDENPSQTTRSYVPATTEGSVPVAIQGGRPYIVKPYKLKGESFTNLGKYVMERFGREFKEYQSSANISPDFYEQLGNRGKVTSQFVKPYEKHKIQAFLNDNDDNTAAYTTHADGTKYYYTFIGQYWEQDLPRYSFYVVGGKWYRYSSGNKNYKWAPYKCIIMASQEVNDDLNTRSNGSGKYRAADRSVIPTVTQELKDDDVFDKEFKLGFLNGLDDDDFDVAPGTASGARHIFELDGDIIEYDEEGNEVTGIKTLDGEDITPLPANLKVYNLNGQFVGSSLEALDKGMYIVNGKKIVVN